MNRETVVDFNLAELPDGSIWMFEKVMRRMKGWHGKFSRAVVRALSHEREQRERQGDRATVVMTLPAMGEKQVRIAHLGAVNMAVRYWQHELIATTDVTRLEYGACALLSEEIALALMRQFAPTVRRRALVN